MSSSVATCGPESRCSESMSFELFNFEFYHHGPVNEMLIVRQNFSQIVKSIIQQPQPGTKCHIHFFIPISKLMLRAMTEKENLKKSETAILKLTLRVILVVCRVKLCILSLLLALPHRHGRTHSPKSKGRRSLQHACLLCTHTCTRNVQTPKRRWTCCL